MNVIAWYFHSVWEPGSASVVNFQVPLNVYCLFITDTKEQCVLGHRIVPMVLQPKPERKYEMDLEMAKRACH